jgi:hypothetical protein
MDFGHYQWLGTTVSLSEDSDLTSGLAEELRQLVKLGQNQSAMPPYAVAPYAVAAASKGRGISRAMRSTVP